MLKAAEEGAGENEAPGPPEKSESKLYARATSNVNFEQVCYSPVVWPLIAWVGVGGGVPPELGKLPPPPGFEMLLFTGEIWREESMDCQTIYAGGVIIIPALREVMTERRIGSWCAP